MARNSSRELDEIAAYLPGQFQSIRDRLCKLEDAIQKLNDGLLRRANIVSGGASEHSAYEIYNLNGCRPAAEEDADALRERYKKFDLFVDYGRNEVFVAGAPRCLSKLETELLCYRLRFFKEASPVDGVYADVWGAIGIEGRACDTTSAVRSAVNGLNAALRYSSLIFLRVSHGRVSWQTPFEFCLLARRGELLTWGKSQDIFQSGNSSNNSATR